MKYFQLPQILYENGKEYYLGSGKMSDDVEFKDWWVCEYSESLKDGYSVHFPPEATDGKEIYYLIGCAESRKKAEKDLLDKINRMTKILTKKDKEKIQKEFEEKRQKRLKKMKNRK